jgi:uncharacterized protein (DUF2236 family)
VVQAHRPPDTGVQAQDGYVLVGSAQAKTTELRSWLAGQVFQHVAGAQGRQRQGQISAAGARWFAEDRPIRRVHSDAAMFVGGLRALLLQLLHPLVMTAVAQHSRYREDPWVRLQRTSFFVAVTTFGPADEAERAVARVRRAHQRVHGTTSDGRVYAASDPHLLRWVHVAEVDSFLAAHQRYGVSRRLDRDERDAYLADTALLAVKLGIPDPPTTEAELRDQLASFRNELASTPEARQAARFLLVGAPLPVAARVPYAALAAAAVGLLPIWARWPLRVPYLPATEATLGRLAGHAVTAAIDWAMTPASSSAR